jgi:lysophospholipase L1-like esterase
MLPLVLPQAIRLRKTAPRFAGARGPKEGTIGAGRQFNLIAVGDSIIAGVGAGDLSKALVGRTAEELAQVLDCRITWHACGIIGADSNIVLHRLLPKLPNLEAAFIMVSVGVNDVTSLSRISAWTRNLAELLSRLHRHSPNAVIAVAGIPPLRGFPLLPQPLRALFGMRGDMFDIAARRLVSQHPWAVYVPIEFNPAPEKFSADGFHPSEDSYREFGQIMADRMAGRFREKPAGKA